MQEKVGIKVIEETANYYVRESKKGEKRERRRREEREKRKERGQTLTMKLSLPNDIHGLFERLVGWQGQPTEQQDQQ
jgi:hypothetical protein